MTPDPTTLHALAARVDALEKALNREVALICKMGDERDTRYTERWAAQQRETDLARQAMGARLETMNEIREQLNQQAATFLSREQAELLVANAATTATTATTANAANAATTANRLASDHAALMGRVTALEHQADLGTGKDTGTLSARALLFSVVAAAAAIIGIVIGIVNLLG